MSEETEKLDLVAKFLKAEAYDIIGQIENLDRQYQSVKAQLQQQLGNLNGQIRDTSQKADLLKSQGTQPTVPVEGVVEEKKLLQE